ncbi:uncharacterized protein DUF1541 [Paramicrobacterium agarici]|nr:uncharacterized protein DUF1541 [Microbacterium agarici]
MAAVAALSALALTGCTTLEQGESPQPSQTQSTSETPTAHGGMDAHNPNGGPPPEATISGAFDTTAYAVSFTPTDGGDPVTDHKWVVQEELKNPGEPPLAAGTEVVLTADHMFGMKGAEATIDSSTDETMYMVNLEMNGMKMTNHKWVVESEIRPAQ